MGDRIKITKIVGGEYDDDVMEDIHAGGGSCGDSGTMCGIFFVDGIEEYHYVSSHVTCIPCISQIEQTPKFIKRNGKWY